jgi:hypothetical protein
MTNAEKLVAVFKQYAGKTFTAKEIQAAFQASYGEPLKTSPSDFAGANPKSGIVYADQIFDRDGSNYKVRETVVPKPKTVRSGQSMEQALASFMDKVADVPVNPEAAA